MKDIRSNYSMRIYNEAISIEPKEEEFWDDPEKYFYDIKSEFLKLKNSYL